MSEMRSFTFSEALDTIFVVQKPAAEGKGEDSFYCTADGDSAMISVCDGCGGLGARQYEAFKGHTGAYVASRAVSGALHDWFRDHGKKEWNDSGKLTDSVDGYIRRAFRLCESFNNETLKIFGSMVRPFPTTLACAYAVPDQEEILIHILWAGDSRIYLLDQDGLAQVTRDDTDIEDAFENLTSDGAMTNVLSSDGDYVIHSRTLHIEKPVILIAATDGCFGYVPSPVEFERLLLEALLASPDPPLFKSALRKFMGEIAGDDLALSFMSFFFGDYKNMQASFADRMHFLKAQYPEVLRDAAEDREILKRAWKNYRHSYERFLR